jgi:hypothetical protein
VTSGKRAGAEPDRAGDNATANEGLHRSPFLVAVFRVKERMLVVMSKPLNCNPLCLTAHALRA